MQDSKFEGLADTANNRTDIQILEFRDMEQFRPNLLVCIYGVSGLTEHNI
jgi:hypothetical protein